MKSIGTVVFLFFLSLVGVAAFPQQVQQTHKIFEHMDEIHQHLKSI